MSGPDRNVRPLLFAAYEEALQLEQAVERLAAAGFGGIETYTPYPLPAVEERLGAKPSPVPLVVLIAGLAGLAGGFGMEVYAAYDYPINIGGRPLFAWPSFVPIAFEIGVLLAVAAGFFAYLIVNRLPRLAEPTGASALVRAASRDRFVLGLAEPEDGDEAARLASVLENTSPLALERVAA